MRFNRASDKLQPYSKTSNTPLYVHSKSNHPPNIIRNIPESVNRLLSNISSDEAVFNEAATMNQDALYKSQYKYKLEFKPLKKAPCQRPLEENCLSEEIVYRAQVTPARKTETNVGLPATEFKARFRNHPVSFDDVTH